MVEGINLIGKENVIQHPNLVSDSPLVSICIQTYNHAQYIRECLDSVLQQEVNFEYEILLGEDSSKDGTREICIEYANKHPKKIRLFLHDRSNVIYINNNPTGRYNFLYNLTEARGKYIALCEGDDFWTDKLKLQKQITYMELHPEISFTFHPVFVCREVGNQLIKSSRGEKLGKVHTTRDFIMNVPASSLSIVFRNDLFLPDWYKSIYGADKYLAILLSLTNNAFCFKERMGVYRVHQNNITNSWANKNLYAELRRNFQSINEFNNSTAKKFAEVIKKFKKKSLHGLKINREDNRFSKALLQLSFTMKYEKVRFTTYKNLLIRIISILTKPR